MSDQIILARDFTADIGDVWELWTTKDGIESWWGPDGFRTDVTMLELRPGGELHYTMTAIGAAEIAHVKQAGLPVATPSRLTFGAIERHRLLTFVTRIDFLPGVAAYDVATRVEFAVAGARVRMTVTLDRMHDAPWTQRMSAGWESQLARLERVLAERRSERA